MPDTKQVKIFSLKDTVDKTTAACLVVETKIINHRVKGKSENAI